MNMQAGSSPKTKFGALKISVLITAGLLVIAAAVALPILLFGSNPYEELLVNGGLNPSECWEEDETLFITFEGDMDGILACREAIVLLRQSEIAPRNLCWTLTADGTILHSETIIDFSSALPANTPLSEPLDEEATEVNIYMELTLQSIKASKIQALSAPNEEGKIVTAHVERKEQSAPGTVGNIRTALKAVNEKGGEILYCNVYYCDDGVPYAVASIDLQYGDTLLSAKLLKK
ncbi:MAG: hypothetical protein J6C26_09720 [Clostridia bacterium]|nr:hypothetical protein [Clostridia bacterium]